MNSQISISVRGLLVTALAVLALLVAYLLGGHGGAVTPPAGAAAPAAAAGGKPGTMTMVGVGKASGVPDQLTFSLSVSEKRLDLDEALAASSATLKRVLAALTPYGVRTADVQTTGLDMNPVYEYHSYAPPTLTGYRVSQRVTVKVRDLAKGGRAIAAAINAGGNQVRARNIRLGIADPEALIAKARDAAVAAATDKAQQYAAATGQDLGTVLTVRELSNPSRGVRPQPVSMRATYDLASLKGALPIRAGKDDLAVRVQVVWAFSGAE